MQGQGPQYMPLPSGQGSHLPYNNYYNIYHHPPPPVQNNSIYCCGCSKSAFFLLVGVFVGLCIVSSLVSALASSGSSPALVVGLILVLFLAAAGGGVLYYYHYYVNPRGKGNKNDGDSSSSSAGYYAQTYGAGQQQQQQKMAVPDVQNMGMARGAEKNAQPLQQRAPPFAASQPQPPYENDYESIPSAPPQKYQPDDYQMQQGEREIQYAYAGKGTEGGGSVPMGAAMFMDAFRSIAALSGRRM